MYIYEIYVNDLVVTLCSAACCFVLVDDPTMILIFAALFHMSSSNRWSPLWFDKFMLETTAGDSVPMDIG